MMIGLLSPMSLRMRRTVSMPLRSGIIQSMMYAPNSSPCSTATLVRSTASLPESVHSERMPISCTMRLTLMAVSESSSATSTRTP